MQYFKGDEKELQVYGVTDALFDSISLSLNAAFEGIYESEPLGGFLYDNELVPLTNAIKRDVFVRAFQQIFESWQFAGTFEAYILVFKKIFGEAVEIVFTVPDPGKLNIDITTTGVELNHFVARSIVNNAYVFEDVIDQDGDNICFQNVLGLETEDELLKVLFILVPSGIYTEVSLTIE